MEKGGRKAMVGERNIGGHGVNGGGTYEAARAYRGNSRTRASPGEEIDGGMTVKGSERTSNPPQAGGAAAKRRK